MRVQTFTNTATDLAATAGVLPFAADNTVYVFNFTAGSLVLQDCDSVGGSYGTLATCGVGITQVTLRKQFVKVSTTANLFAVGD
jgi:hypothetical protein